MKYRFNMKKCSEKLTAILLCALMTVSAAGCGSSSSSTATEAAMTQTTAAETQTTEEPASTAETESEPAVTIGDTIQFGSYEQDGNRDNGAEAIEWTVLDVTSDKALVISTYGLLKYAFDTDYENTTWENCDLRSYLNDTFLSGAFNNEEYGQILTSTVTADENPQHSTDQGSDTQDKVFILSASEARKYLSSDQAICIPTEVVKSNSRNIVGEYRQWWLRTGGKDKKHYTTVSSNGEIDYTGAAITGPLAVRPAMWISLTSESSTDSTEATTIKFGKYEQNNDSSDGEEDIEWIILAKEDDRALVISYYGLDIMAYNNDEVDTSWENCSLREWLNTSFLSSAFSSEEMDRILTTDVSADMNPKSSLDPGNAVQDKIFLLSINEVENYIKGDEARMCIPTAYAKDKGALESSKLNDAGSYFWWLRSPGEGWKYMAACINSFGAISYSGARCTCKYLIRPVMWITLDSTAGN